MLGKSASKNHFPFVMSHFHLAISRLGGIG